MESETRVLYNDTCPVCRFEIDAYKRQTAHLPIRYDPLTRAADWGLTADQAARVLHVEHGGQRLSGLPAFRALWSAMPRWRWLARLTGLPVVASLADATYRLILAPLLYRAHLRRQRRALRPR